jgi:aspartyl-tRNA(Asn)/glutamyl-tRNA(Gln) amidotransferase subunit A
MELDEAGVEQLAAAVRGGEVSAEEVARAALARIEDRDGDLRSFLRTTPERALQAARLVDEAVREGRDPGPLAGVPIALKDNLELAGETTTCASRILEGHRALEDAGAVRAILEAGALPVGQTNMDEFAMGSSNETSAAGPCGNPHDLSRVPGGSSGGSAAAVAAGLVPAALGSDTGGSIRLPAAFCGVLGLKPTYGVVSRRGLVAFASSLDQVGPMARDARGLARLFLALARPDPGDSTSVEFPDPEAVLPELDRDLRGLRLGLVQEWMGEGTEPAVRDAVQATLERLREAGAEVRELHLPSTQVAVPAYYVLACAEASSNLARFDGVRYGHRAPGEDVQAMMRSTRAAGFGAEVKRRILVGTFVLSSGYQEAWYGRAQAVRTRIRRELEEALDEVDLLVGPTAPTVAFPQGSRSDPVEMYRTDVCTVAANLAGLPAISIPCGEAPDTKLPIGLQGIGRPFAEAVLLRLAAGVEAVAGYHGRDREAPAP